MNRVKEIVEKVAQEAKKSGKISIFSIANTANKNNPPLLFPAIRETDSTIAGNILVTSEEQIKQVIEIVDGLVDIILMDTERKTPAFQDVERIFREQVHKSRLLTFKPNDLTVEALDAFLVQIASPLSGKKVAVIGAGNIGSKIALKLVERNISVILTRRNKEVLQKIVTGINAIKPIAVQAKVECTTDGLEACRGANIIIGAANGVAVVTNEMVMVMNASGWIIDVGNGTLSPEAVQEADKRGISVLCLFVKPAYDGAIKTILETEQLIQKIARRSLGHFSILSGGVLGKKGDVIVDDAYCPRRILAIADGRGDVLPDIRDPSFRKNIEEVESIIQKGNPQ
ncbi:MAG: hypothetical protein A2W61_03135 [Deltaproteobacteria bacterium RIFCSPLOWO2_01_44_7]|nr:MAG: hypothetical protein A2712_02615 [Deltaproteobacteria bacterium RIFCSPHIGHO2_01_FULL_43_49]OGQ16089.1 MAG: hypothetical protein A3D22_00585 [Deltaproteobacteria bacterium RIFCSPHIGHO2_02_FULL_44_53]OGQ29050.1 MAG: hypothetical protein A3D98_04370 [Deltaproteobacteria bacterium RIFCSPHIGHO2_12_FULL_44_21]OGQ32606.1 MAG: hypothetical protein A2979_08515 [Deltaproteobacteria bacterium RIFCSPLOWO2_01_FULL_45_74]OGQ38348.1 MAG: hypothetical protein A2W61_03135 [Deltaproteobacteria bacterium 